MAVEDPGESAGFALSCYSPQRGAAALQFLLHHGRGADRSRWDEVEEGVAVARLWKSSKRALRRFHTSAALTRVGRTRGPFRKRPSKVYRTMT